MDYGSAEPDPDSKEIFTDPHKKLSLILIKMDGVTILDFRDIDWSRVWLEVFYLKTQVFKVNYPVLPMQFGQRKILKHQH
jgi:hypothetical protein